VKIVCIASIRQDGDRAVVAGKGLVLPGRASRLVRTGFVMASRAIFTIAIRES